MKRLWLIVGASAIAGVVTSVGLHRHQQAQCTSQVRSSYFADDFSRAVDQAMICNRKFGPGSELLAWAAIAQMRSERPLEAKRTALSIASQYPGDPYSHFAMAGVHLFDDDPTVALKNANEAVASEPSNENFVWALADILRLHHRYADALSEINKSSADREGWLLTSERGAILADRAKDIGYSSEALNNALRAFDDALRRSPGTARPSLLAGYALLDAGKITTARAYLAKAASLSGSASVHARYWSSIEQSNRLSDQEKKQLITRDIASLRQGYAPSPAVLASVSEQLSGLGLIKASDNAKRELILAFPESIEASQIKLFQLNDQINQRGQLSQLDMQAAARSYITLARIFELNESQMQEQALQSAMTLARREVPMDAKTLQSAARKLAEVTVSPSAMAVAANALTDSGAPLWESENTAKRGMARIPLYFGKVGITAPGERERLTAQFSSQLTDAVGYALLRAGISTKAMNEFSRAAQLDPSLPDPYQHLGILFEQSGDWRSAEQELTKCASLQAATTDLCDKRLRSLWSRYNPARPEWAQSDRTFKNHLVAVKASLMLTGEPSTRIRPTFTISSDTGEEFKSEMMRGKIVVMAFWGSWCAVCKVELPAVLSFAASTQGNEVKLILVNDNRDPAGNRLWLRNQRNAPPSYNGSDIFPMFQITNVPTLLIFDKKGGLAYRMQGLSPSLIEDLSFRVNRLGSETIH